MSYKKYPTKKRRYSFKRQLKRKFRRILFMVIAVAFASGISYYNKNYSSPQNKQNYQESAKFDNSHKTGSRQSNHTDQSTLQELEIARNNPNAKLWVTVHGKVIKQLKDDLIGNRHQKFLIEIDKNFTLLVSHNIDLAPRAPIKKGSKVSVSGLYEWNNRGGVIHWTHHDPRGKKKGGWIKVNDKQYK